MPSFFGNGSLLEVAAGAMTLSIPGSAPAGSVLFATIIMRGGGFITVAPGWNVIHATNTGNNSTVTNQSRSSVLIAWAPYSVGMNTTFSAPGGRAQGIISVYTDVDTTTPYTAMQMSTEAMAQLHQIPGMNVNAGQMLLSFALNPHRSSINSGSDWNTLDGLNPSPANWSNPSWTVRFNSISPNNPRSTFASATLDVPQTGATGAIGVNMPPFQPPSNPFNQLVTLALQSPQAGPVDADTGQFLLFL